MKDLLEIIVFLNFILRTTDLYEPWYFSSKKKKKNIDKWKEYTIKVKQLYSCYKHDTSWIQ